MRGDCAAPGQRRWAPMRAPSRGFPRSGGGEEAADGRVEAPEVDEEGVVALDAGQPGEGHRDAGHLRASIYNAVTYEQCQALTEFMTDFQKRFG